MTPMARAAPAKLAPTAVKMSRVVSALGDENDMDEEDMMIGYNRKCSRFSFWVLNLLFESEKEQCRRRIFASLLSLLSVCDVGGEGDVNDDSDASLVLLYLENSKVHVSEREEEKESKN